MDTVGAGWTGVGVNRLGPLGLMLFCVEDTGGGVVVVVVVVVVEGFSSPLPPHAAVSPPIAIRAPVPATAARQRTLRDLIVFPIYPRPVILRRACTSVSSRKSADQHCRLHLHVTGESALRQAIRVGLRAGRNATGGLLAVLPGAELADRRSVTMSDPLIHFPLDGKTELRFARS